MTSDLRERLRVPSHVPLLEAHSADPDPFFSRPLAFSVTREDIREGLQRNHENCAIACALRNGNHVKAACVQSRAVYLVRTYPKNGLKEKLQGCLVITKHQLSAAGIRLVRQFDRTKKAPKGLIEVIPLAPSHTSAVRKTKRGTGTPRGHGHKQKKVRRPVWLRSRLAPRVTTEASAT